MSATRMTAIEEIQKTALRVPRGLHEKLHQAAQASGRSFNAEIVMRLQDSFGKEQQPSGDALLKKAENLYEKLEKIMAHINKNDSGQVG